MNLYENQDTQRSRALAEALMSQGMNPQPVAGHFGKANMYGSLANVLMGGLVNMQADKRDRTRREGINQTLADALKGPQAPADGVGPVQDKNDYLISALSSNPDTAPMAFEYQMKQRGDEADLQRALALAKARSEFPDTPYFSPLTTTEGIFNYDHRTGRTAPLAGGGGKPIMAPTADPNLAGAKARAAAEGKAQGEASGDISKRAIGAGEVLDLIGRAEQLIPAATSSGIGTMVDKTAGLFGATPQGAEEAQTLKMIQGALVLKMPRMEGPQSNLDQQLYREMAGQLGDSTLPAKVRLAAAAELRRLNEKYAAYNGSGGAPLAVPPGGGDAPANVRDWNDLD